MENNSILADRCMNILREHVGTVETEAFIYYIRSQSFDYTQWQKEHYDTMTPETIYQSLEEHSADHPFQGKKAIII